MNLLLEICEKLNVQLEEGKQILMGVEFEVDHVAVERHFGRWELWAVSAYHKNRKCLGWIK